MQQRVLPGTPATSELAVSFPLLLDPAARAARWLGSPEGMLRATLLESLMRLASTVQAAAFNPALRQRMDPEALGTRPCHQLGAAVAALHASIMAGDSEAALRDAAILRALL